MVSRFDAIDYYKELNQMDKASSLRYISNSSVSLYRLDDTLDYFYGVLPRNTEFINKYKLKHIKDNKIILLYPYLYDMTSEMSFKKNDTVLSIIDENDKLMENFNISTSSDLNKIISKGNYEEIIKIGEILLNDKLIDVVKKLQTKKEIRMILIDGPVASGKTTIAKRLSLFLKSYGYDPIEISIHNFHKETPSNNTLNIINNIDTNLFNNKISELFNNKEVFMPKYNFNTNKREWDENKVTLKDNSILIIEGINVFDDKLTEMIPDKNKYKLFINVQTPLNIDNHNLFRASDNRLLRNIVKDNKFKNMSVCKTLSYWKDIRKIEEAIIFPSMMDADEIINTSLMYELGILKTYAEPLLFSVSEDSNNYDEALRLINLFRVILSIPSDSIPKDSVLREFIGDGCFEK